MALVCPGALVSAARRALRDQFGLKSPPTWWDVLRDLVDPPQGKRAMLVDVRQFSHCDVAALVIDGDLIGRWVVGEASDIGEHNGPLMPEPLDCVGTFVGPLILNFGSTADEQHCVIETVGRNGFKETAAYLLSGGLQSRSIGAASGRSKWTRLRPNYFDACMPERWSGVDRRNCVVGS